MAEQPTPKQIRNHTGPTADAVTGPDPVYTEVKQMYADDMAAAGAPVKPGGSSDG